MIVLVIEGTYPWYRGGVSEWVSKYLKAFRDTDFTIIQIATDEYRTAKLSAALYKIPSNVKNFLRISPPSIERHTKDELTIWSEKVLERFNYKSVAAGQCVHVTNTGFAGWLGKKIAEKYKKPLVLTEHAIYWKEVDMGAVALECGYKIPRYDIDKVVDLFQNIAKVVYEYSDEVISVSECNIEDQRELGAKKIEYIPNGVEDSWLIPEKDYSDPLIVGWIGRCAEMKNPLKFIEVAEAFNRRANCVMMLSDAGEKDLKKQVKSRASNVGNLELIWNRPAKEYIDKMDALCITSHNESQPLVLFEALARRILPVGWEVGDVTSKYAFIQDGDCSPREFAKNVLQLWKRKHRWQAAIDDRFTQLQNNHTWSSIFESYRKKLQPYLC